MSLHAFAFRTNLITRRQLSMLPGYATADPQPDGDDEDIDDRERWNGKGKPGPNENYDRLQGIARPSEEGVDGGLGFVFLIP